MYLKKQLKSTLQEQVQLKRNRNGDSQ